MAVLLFCETAAGAGAAVDFFLEAVAFFDDVFLFVVESVAPKSEISAKPNARKTRKESV